MYKNLLEEAELVPNEVDATGEEIRRFEKVLTCHSERVNLRTSLGRTGLTGTCCQLLGYGGRRLWHLNPSFIFI